MRTKNLLHFIRVPDEALTPHGRKKVKGWDNHAPGPSRLTLLVCGESTQGGLGVLCTIQATFLFKLEVIWNNLLHKIIQNGSSWTSSVPGTSRGTAVDRACAVTSGRHGTQVTTGHYLDILRQDKYLVDHFGQDLKADQSALILLWHVCCLDFTVSKWSVDLTVWY
jgi:hypothetical protein